MKTAEGKMGGIRGLSAWQLVDVAFFSVNGLDFSSCVAVTHHMWVYFHAVFPTSERQEYFHTESFIR